MNAARKKLLMRLLLPPLAPVILLLGLSVWVVVSETWGTPRMIDGRGDDSPRYAAFFIVILSPFFYLVFACINLIDSACDRFQSGIRVVWASIMLVGFGYLLFGLLHSPKFGESSNVPIAAAAGISLAIIVPMNFWRRHLTHATSAPRARS